MYFLSIIKNSRFTLSYLRVNSLFQMSALWILQNQAHRFLWFETPERDSADHLQTAVNSGPNWRLFGLFRIWKLDWQYFSWNWKCFHGCLPTAWESNSIEKEMKNLNPILEGRRCLACLEAKYISWVSIASGASIYMHFSSSPSLWKILLI